MADKTTFDPIAKTLHWLLAILIIVSLVFGKLLEELPDLEKAERLVMHSGMGLIILVLVIFRIYWRRGHTPPPLPETMTERDRKIAHGNTHLLYFLMLYQPVVGLLHAATYVSFDIKPFGLFSATSLLPSSEVVTKVFHVMHGAGAWLLILAILVHIAASFKHLLIDKDRVFQRMFPGAKG